MLFSTSALAPHGPTPKLPEARTRFCRLNWLPRSSLAALRVSMWKRMAALMRPLSITMRCMPIDTMVASICCRCRARKRRASGTSCSGLLASTDSSGPTPSVARISSALGIDAPPRRRRRMLATSSGSGSSSGSGVSYSIDSGK
ncbi:hypothetical protein [Luteimonas aquatica]|uniref:hypothetical protein n=1 Tax=Luteimonas aquatica TaxID=450364 RepID=UPI001F57016C|nr:hypothetical protein [Luteimonas aquatica]